VPQEFRNDDSAGADVAIFHAFVPTDPPPVNTLYSYPPPGNGFLHSATRDVVGAQILDWNDADPILHDLRYVEALPLDRTRLLELPAWAHTLIASRAEGREFPLAFAGETAGRRIVCFGFAFVPGLASFPCGETKIASASVPSIPSQFESTNERSGRSGAPGWIAGSLGAQSFASTVPSWSASGWPGPAGVGGCAGDDGATVPDGGRCPCGRTRRNSCAIAWLPARSPTGFDLVRVYRIAGFAFPSGIRFSTR